MADLQPSEPPCGEPMEFPPPLCTRPRGHNGIHETSMIPVPLLPVAERMVRESDRFERARAHAEAERETYESLRARWRVRLILISSGLVFLSVANVIVLAILAPRV